MLRFFVTPEEMDRIRLKMERSQVRNLSAYLRKMALDGYCISLDTGDIRELISSVRENSRLLDTLLEQAGKDGSVDPGELRALQQSRDSLWEAAREIIEQMSQIR